MLQLGSRFSATVRLHKDTQQGNQGTRESLRGPRHGRQRVIMDCDFGSALKIAKGTSIFSTPKARSVGEPSCVTCVS